jgi:type IV pilus assembly protein PilO
LNFIFRKFPYEKFIDTPPFKIFFIAGGIGLVLFLASFFTVLDSSEAEIRLLKKNIADTENTFKRYFKLVANKNTVNKKLSLKLGELGIKKNQLPAQNGASNLIKKLTALGEKRGVEVTSFKISNSDAHEFYREVDVQLKLSGGLWATMDMISSIENMLQIVNLDKITFNLANQNDELAVSSSFAAKIYVYLENI